ncbi:MAG: branched-chain amino acid ABC transporter permease [Candidatus Rokubacteria bacterium]|nr:branched-chain amino acid ABC transporter permease [Candidatus Rokubacteria bacterium]
MKRVVARALLQDAFSQVMDNKVFRLLVLASITLIAPAFLIGFREDGIHILFGWKSITYAALFDTVSAPVPHVKDLNVYVIQGVQTAIVQGLAGGLGILFCIAATAFFVPRMLEKGAADTLFTKPLSRVVLLLSRYVAGLIFVGALSFRYGLRGPYFSLATLAFAEMLRVVAVNWKAVGSSLGLVIPDRGSAPGLFLLSIQGLLPPIVGGTGTVLGPLLGSFVLTPVSEATRAALRGRAGADVMLYGLTLVLVVSFLPRGLMGWLRRRRA